MATRAQIEATMRYNKKKYERVSMLVKPEVKSRWKANAESLGVSLTEYMTKCEEYYNGKTRI